MGVCAWFADVLEYPDETLPERLRKAPPADARIDLAVRDSIARFDADAARLGVTALQEAYTAAFDLDGRCALYVGHHLFGEDVRRSLFMARLACEYRAWAPSAAGQDLPDRLPAMLRYLDAPIPDDERRELIEHAILPAVRRVTQALADRDHPYAPLLRALIVTLEARA